jgi:feruloyl esterase
VKHFSASVILLCAALLLGGARATAAEIVCNGSLTGTIAANLVVPAGAGCMLYQARVSGDVRVMQDATLLVDGREEWTSIGGNVTAAGCVSALLDGSVTVHGDIEIHACRSTSGFTGPGIKIHGNFLCQNNRADCKAVLGEIDGNVEISNNKSGAASDISLTAIAGNLQCQQNTPAPTHGLGGDWVAGQLSGQCGANSGLAAAPYACGALTGLALPDTTISLAQIYAAGQVITGTVTAPVTLCRVAATINPSTNPSHDSDINFEVWLPLAGWTGRYEQAGNGGDAGSIRYVFDVGSLSTAVATGNAAASTDDGSSKAAGAPSGIWALGHPQRINDFYHRAVHRTNLNGRVITAAFYGTPPTYKYFKGCSKGGDEGIMEAQRYPEDFDGIMVGDGTGFYSRSTETNVWSWQHINNPTYNSAGFISNSSLPAITSAVQAACAATRTVPTDNFLGDPTQCHFDAQQIFSGILTPQQINNLQAVYAGPVNSAGDPLAPGFEPGNEALNWPGFITQFVPAPAFVYYIQETPATFNIFTDYNFDTTPGFFDTFPISPPSPGSAPQTIGSASNAAPDLSAFKARGGKLIHYHGWEDNQIPSLDGVDYFKSIVVLEEEKHPKGKSALEEAQSYYRLFMVPGMGHCRGGPGLNEFGRNGGAGPASQDLFTALEAWVEQGAAPAQVTAWNCPNQTFTSSCTIQQGTFTRPLCPYPQKAVYVGTGSTSHAANFTCQ